MSLAEDLLNSLPENQPAVTSADPATEPHIVINADKTVIIPEALKRILVQHDHNIETVTFDCPRYWDGHDLSQMGLRIVFQRSDDHKEPHPVENLRVDESNDRMIHFDWTISGNTTLVSGNVKITVCAKLTNAEGVSEREWHTIPNQDLFVNEGMDCSGEEIVERNPDVIEYILAELDDLKNTGGVSDDQVANAVAEYLQEHPIDPGVDAQEVRDIVDEYLAENPPTPTPDSGQNVTIGILGDSYSAYVGSIPAGYQASYGVNDYNGITSEEQMWYRILASRMGATVLRNSSYSGSTISNSGYNGANATASSFLTRAAADFGNAQDRKPSKLFVLGGINDDWAGTTVGEAKYSDWTEDDLKTVAPAACKLFHDLLANNPGTDIVFILNDIISDGLKTVLLDICGHYGVRCIELADIAKESSHPTVEGMAQIAAQIWGAMNQGTTIDPTLTQSGAAADAKAVGDALAGKVAGIGITTIMAITQAKYDELVMLGTVDESTLYIIKPESEDSPDLTMIPVLRSDGTAYIDLGIAPIDGAWYEVCFRAVSAIETRAIFGNRYTNVGGSGGDIDNTWMRGYYNGSAYATFPGGTVDISRKHIFALSSTALTLDGDAVIEITAGTNKIVNGMLLFSANNSMEKNGMYVITPVAIDLFYLRIWSNENKLLHNYVPAQDSDGVACIYDTVEKAYLYNAAESGAFEYREELEES